MTCEDSLMTFAESDRLRLRETFEQVSRVSEVFGLSFYSRLFDQPPDLRELFQNETDRPTRMLFAFLRRAIDSLEDWAGFVPELEALGRRHGYFGVQFGMYSVFVDAFVWALGKTLDEKWEPGSDDKAWTALLNAMGDVMKVAASPIESAEVDTAVFFKKSS
jgi:hemoglobin-like flavoprotein